MSARTVDGSCSTGPPDRRHAVGRALFRCTGYLIDSRVPGRSSLEMPQQGGIQVRERRAGTNRVGQPRNVRQERSLGRHHGVRQLGRSGIQKVPALAWPETNAQVVVADLERDGRSFRGRAERVHPESGRPDHDDGVHCAIGRDGIAVIAVVQAQPVVADVGPQGFGRQSNPHRLIGWVQRAAETAGRRRRPAVRIFSPASRSQVPAVSMLKRIILPSGMQRYSITLPVRQVSPHRALEACRWCSAGGLRPHFG